MYVVVYQLVTVTFNIVYSVTKNIYICNYKMWINDEIMIYKVFISGFLFQN